MSLRRQVIIAPSRRAFTLVELLVVIAIIGVLVALLLPAIQAAREAARRTQCRNNVKQIMLSMLNHESAKKCFPSGGIDPWPNLALYLNGINGTPYGPDKQGLGWAFQILPYLEGNQVYNVKTEKEVVNIVVPWVNCPSRRGPTRWSGIDAKTGVSPYLMDYAAAVPFRSRGQLGIPPGPPNPYFAPQGADTRGCSQYTFWGAVSGGPRHVGEIPGQTAPKLGASYAGYWGVIVRSGLAVQGTPAAPFKTETGFYDRISFEQIIDGSSNTLVIGEKRMQPTKYDTGDWNDDRGWTGGWDPDGLRSTICQIGADVITQSPEPEVLGYRFGSAHSSGMNAGFADGSVHAISYDIDLEMFNRLGHRSDEEDLNLESVL